MARVLGRLEAASCRCGSPKPLGATFRVALWLVPGDECGWFLGRATGGANRPWLIALACGLLVPGLGVCVRETPLGLAAGPAKLWALRKPAASARGAVTCPSSTLWRDITVGTDALKTGRWAIREAGTPVAANRWLGLPKDPAVGRTFGGPEICEESGARTKLLPVRKIVDREAASGR